MTQTQAGAEHGCILGLWRGIQFGIRRHDSFVLKEFNKPLGPFQISLRWATHVDAGMIQHSRKIFDE